jgi:hypothetical protein
MRECTFVCFTHLRHHFRILSLGVVIDLSLGHLLQPLQELIFDCTERNRETEREWGIVRRRIKEEEGREDRSNCAARRAFLSRPTSRRSTFVFVVTIFGLIKWSEEEERKVRGESLPGFQFQFPHADDHLVDLGESLFVSVN